MEKVPISCLKCESARRCFQPGEGPSKGQIIVKLQISRSFVWSSNFHCASLRPGDYRELGANYYHKISAIKETFRLSSIMKISGDQFFYPSQIFWSFNEFYREEKRRTLDIFLFIWPSFWWLGWFQSRGRVSLIWYSDMIEIFNFKSEGEIKEKCQHISSVSWEIDIGETEYIYFIFCY